MVLYLRMISWMERGISLEIDLGLQIPSFSSTKPLSAIFFIRSLIGAVIHTLPVDILLSISLYLIILAVPRLEATLLIWIDRNFALWDLALVMSVFSSESSSFSPLRRSWILYLMSEAVFLLPQTPIIQSSAYLTYFILMTSGFGTVDFNSLLSFMSLLYRSDNTFFSARSSLLDIFFLRRCICIEVEWYNLLVMYGFFLPFLLSNSDLRFSTNTSNSCRSRFESKGLTIPPWGTPLSAFTNFLLFLSHSTCPALTSFQYRLINRFSLKCLLRRESSTWWSIVSK